jgi:hypothetical protein
MTAQEDPYVRVYYRVLTDEKFKPLSSAAWGHWVRLLTVADGMFPSSAPLPRWVERKPLQELVAAGIVDLDGSDYFRIHGMEPERASRAEAARFAADVKHHGLEEAERRRSERSAGAVQPHADAAPTAATQRTRATPQPRGRAEPASPLLSAPIQSAPLQAAPASAHSKNGTTTKKEPPEDEATIIRCLAILSDPDAPDWKKSAAKDQLGFMGVRP